MGEETRPSLQNEPSPLPQGGPVDVSNFYREASPAPEPEAKGALPRVSVMASLRMWSERHKLLAACLACAGIFGIIFSLFFLLSDGGSSATSKELQNFRDRPQFLPSQLPGDHAAQ